MIKLGFRRCETDLCLWSRGVGTELKIFVTNFWDDIVMTGPHEVAFRTFTEQLSARWGDCKVQAPAYLLGCD